MFRLYMRLALALEHSRLPARWCAAMGILLLWLTGCNGGTEHFDAGTVASTLLPGPGDTWDGEGCAPAAGYRRLRMTIRFAESSRMPAEALLKIHVGRSTRALCVTDAFRASRRGRLERDTVGNLIATFPLGTASTGTARMVSLTWRVGAPDPTETAAAARFLAGDRLAPAEHPRIRLLARQILSRSTKVHAQSIGDWIETRIRPRGYVRRDRSALEVLEEQAGDCTDLSALAVALYRAAGIPARIVTGYVCSGACREPSPHAWVERFDGSAWLAEDFTRSPRALDPQRAIGLATLAPDVPGAPLSSRLVWLEPVESAARIRIETQVLPP